MPSNAKLPTPIMPQVAGSGTGPIAMLLGMVGLASAGMKLRVIKALPRKKGLLCQIRRGTRGTGQIRRKVKKTRMELGGRKKF